MSRVEVYKEIATENILNGTPLSRACKDKGIPESSYHYGATKMPEVRNHIEELKRMREELKGEIPVDTKAMYGDALRGLLAGVKAGEKWAIEAAIKNKELLVGNDGGFKTKDVIAALEDTGMKLVQDEREHEDDI